MSLDPVKKLAETLAQTANEQTSIKENLSADDSEALLQTQLSETVVVDGTLGLTAVKHTYALDSFVLDHPTLGDLDSSVLALDGGYEPITATFPLTYPIVFGEGEELFNINI